MTNLPQTYIVKLDRRLGLMEGKNKYVVSSPLENATEFVQKEYLNGSEVEILLKSGEVKILDFR
ncbi:hypothetical protein QSE00_19960 [Arenibacter sp. M-2]|uniref:hypothetical protein n=1 Tax=Arenibacter sp. M-2 TaxID=3053612 RepID=UPI0025705FE0|nr:hypothetical protein [Arenibacter sp. M-2]MDL5514100.1 hypothetical protein [Arenibacter sp. M-2]